MNATASACASALFMALMASTPPVATVPMLCVSVRASATTSSSSLVVSSCFPTTPVRSSSRISCSTSFTASLAASPTLAFHIPMASLDNDLFLIWASARFGPARTIPSGLSESIGPSQQSLSDAVPTRAVLVPAGQAEQAADPSASL